MEFPRGHVGPVHMESRPLVTVCEQGLGREQKKSFSVHSVASLVSGRVELNTLLLRGHKALCSSNSYSLSSGGFLLSVLVKEVRRSWPAQLRQRNS